jgi:hypothetical protein
VLLLFPSCPLFISFAYSQKLCRLPPCCHSCLQGCVYREDSQRLSWIKGYKTRGSVVFADSSRPSFRKSEACVAMDRKEQLGSSVHSVL